MDIAIDGGTTNTRAALLNGQEILATARCAVGARDTAKGGSGPLLQAVASAVREAMAEAAVTWGEIDRVVASGMLTSAAGLCEVPHVWVPAEAEDVAASVVARLIPEIAPKPIYFVPGIRTDNDMMRGEECEVFGILAQTNRQGPAWILLPGSHTKLISIDGRNRIDGMQTSMAGEVLAALAHHTILRASLPEGLPPNPDLEIVREGACRAETTGALSAAFQTRILHVLEQRSPEHCAAFLTGVVIGTDILELSRAGFFEENLPIWVGGPEPLRSVYADLASFLLGEQRKQIEVLDAQVCEKAAALGARVVALAAEQNGNLAELSEVQGDSR